MLGLMQDFRKACNQYFKQAGNKVFLLGKIEKSLGGSEYLKQIHQMISGDIAKVDLAEEKKVQDCVVSLIENSYIRSAHDLSDGGLAVALAECCFNPESNFGFQGSFELAQESMISYFGESGANVIVSLDADREADFIQTANSHKLEYHYLGEVTESESFVINDDIKVCVNTLRAAYEEGLKI
jgi:phosphoribosylformylglycinamidine synthase